MIRFKEFYDKEKPNGKYISASQQANDFMSQNNVEYVDVRYFITSGDIQLVCILLVYKEKGDE